MAYIVTAYIVMAYVVMASQALAEMFKLMDTDGSGNIDQQELKSFLEASPYFFLTCHVTVGRLPSWRCRTGMLAIQVWLTTMLR